MGNGRRKRGVIMKQSAIGHDKGRREKKNASDGVTIWVYRAIDLMKEGYTSKYIFNHILENKKTGNSTGTINQIIGNASQIINNQYTQKVKDTQVIHVRRYNDNINRLLKTEEISMSEMGSGKYTWEEFYAARNRKIKAFNDAINSIVQKENCLQMNSVSFTIEINEEKTVNIKETKPKFDTSKLTFEEQVELYELMKKAKQGENELLSVIELDQANTGEITESVSVVAEIPANVTHIKQEVLEVKEEKPLYILDPAAKLKETLKKIAAKRLQEVGANLDIQEKSYLEVKK